ncbi:MAG: hypothetical protein IJ156_05895 [Bacteroidales bacterium]|nr:hypothetical protein [Bacteroidales bacterium]
MMKKLILLTAAALFSGAVFAQTLSLKVPENVPEAAREVLVQRFTQMLQGAGVAVGEGGETLFIEATVSDRMETPGSASQTALSVNVRAYILRDGEVLVENTWPVKGVGSGEDDAWLRAAKQILPRSKAAQAFMEEVKSKL